MSIRGITIICFILLCFPGRCFGQAQGCFERDSTGSLVLRADPGFGSGHAFLVGEFHDVPHVPEIKLALLKYLHEQNGVNAVFMEIGKSAAYLYNRYLETGDTGYICNPALVYNSTDEGRAFWRKLYEYNRVQKCKLTICGIDFERMDFLKTMRLLKPADMSVLGELQAFVTYAESAKILQVNTDTLQRVYAAFSEAFFRYEDAFMGFYGPNFDCLKAVLTNPNTYSAYNERNRNMYRNIMVQVGQGNITGYVVFAGLKHGGDRKAGTLANELRKKNGVMGKTKSIAMLCYDCKGTATKSEAKGPHYGGPATYSGDNGVMDRVFESGLGGNCQYRLVPSSSVKYWNIRQFSEYLLLIR